MKRLSIILLCLLSFACGFSQITNAEYFFDSDPGIGNGTALAITPSATLDQNFSISTTGLTSGIHKLFVRVQAGGLWSIYDKNVFYVNPNHSNSASITAAEYFIDNDPGIGNGIPLTMNGDVIDQNYSIPTTGLSEGIHKLFVRVINADGSWSIYDKNVFYINPTQSNMANIAAAEYFFDSDPGIGNGTTLVMSGNNVDQNYSIPTTGLSSGIHRLYVRVINDDGSWSIYDKNVFYINPDHSNTANIAAAEYFIDTDPGVGNGTSLTVSGNTIDQNFNIPTTGLSNGIHKLFVRVINEDGAWSIYDKNVFFVNPYQTNNALIAAAEYFIDTDPGVGMGTPLTMTGGVVDELYNIPTTGLTEGDYTLYVRAINTDGSWSIYGAQNFTIGPPDADMDGILDDVDNCPTIANAGQEDIDMDTIGDVCDNCPDNANTDQLDDDSDGVGNICDACPGFDDTIDDDMDNFADGCDCNDNNASINPDASDIPDNGIDENCDGFDLLTWYADSDSDNFGNPNVTQTANSQPVGYVSDNTDCDDTNADIYPGATETPDNDIDEDCDGFDLKTWYADTDGDTYGDSNVTQTSNSQPADYVSDNTDCDDTNANIYPGATEIPDNGIDEDCDGLDLLTWYADADGDNYGDVNVTQTSNTQPTDYVSDNTDCDDTNANIYPGATETPDNGIDEDCDGSDLLTWYADADGDSYGDPNVSQTSNTQPSGYVSDNTDCDDTNAGINPGATEIPENGIDEDCDGSDNAIWYQDSDGDGYGNPDVSQLANSQPTGYVSDNTDCDDTEANAFPGNTEVCDGIDNDCNGEIDEGVQSTFYADTDGDGYGDASSTVQACSAPTGYVADNTDCDDTEANNFPGNPEVCDGIDNDCDGEIDEGVLITFYADSDGDGFGDANITTQACTAPTGYVDNNTDCDDTEANIFPGNTEVCDGIDNDCDGEIDEGTFLTFYADSDSDGFGDPNMTVEACSAPNGYVDNSSDCNDNDASINPNADEIPNDNIDQDCDGSDLFIPDSDDDGVLDNVDNCINTPNPDQLDTDNDGIGDECEVKGIIVPKGFSPNGDNINDTWEIENITSFPRNNVKVFNRWGNKVFETINYQNNWNGESQDGGGNNKLPVGPYLYIIELNEPGFGPVQGWIYINY